MTTECFNELLEIAFNNQVALDQVEIAEYLSYIAEEYGIEFSISKYRLTDTLEEYLNELEK